MTEEQTLTQPTDAAIAAPWRDGTTANAISANWFDLVVFHALYHSPESTQFIKNNSAGAYISSVANPQQMETGHYEYLFAALDDAETRDLIDKLAARVRLVAEPLRPAV